MPTTDPFADLSSSAPADTSSDPFASLNASYDPGTGAPAEVAPEAPKPNFGSRAKEFVHSIPETAGNLAPYLAAGFVPGGGIAVAGGTAMKAVENQRAIGQLQHVIDAIPDVNVRAKTADYFQKLQTLKSKGWTDEQIMDEARKRASNVALGAQATRESLDQDVATIQGTNAAGLPAEAVTNAVFFGSGNRVLGALGSGLGKMGISVAAKPAATVAGRVAQSFVRHAAAGAAIGAAGLGAGGATQNALMAWAQTKPLHEIGQELVRGAKEHGTAGAIGGGILGGALGPALEGVVEHVQAGRAAKLQSAADEATAKARDLATQTAEQAAKREAAIQQTADQFNPHDAKVPEGTDPVEAATTIIQQAHGDNASMSEAGLRAATQIAEKIKLYQDANEVLNGNVALPAPMGPDVNRLPGLQPVGAPLEGQVPGEAPEPNAPLSVQTPVGASGSGTPVPGQATPFEGLEGASTPSAAPPEPVLPQGPQPTEGAPVAPAARLSQPLGPVANSAGTETGLAVEPNARTLAPAPPGTVPEVPSGLPAGGLSRADLMEPANRLQPEAKVEVKPKAKRPGKQVTTEAQGDLFAPPVDENSSSGAKKTPEQPVASTPEVPAPPTATVAESAPLHTTRNEPNRATDTFADLEGNAPKTPEESNAAIAHPETAPAPGPKPAELAVSKLAAETHADVTMTEDGSGLRVQLGVKPGEVAKPGGPATALDNIARVADEHGVPVETHLVPAPAPKGGKIPLEKLIPWYEARGFKVVESTRIPEGNLATAKLVREPIGEHQNEVATKLEKAAVDARARIAKKAGRLNSGFDPTMIGDYAIELAADTFSRRLRDRDEMASWAVQKWGDTIQPFIDKIIDRAQKHFTRLFKETGEAEKNLNDLLQMRESGKHGMGWYEETAKWSKQKFGSDSDMFLRFLSVTSANSSTEAGAAMALKAYSQWKMDMPFEGFRGQAMSDQLRVVSRGEALPENTKIQNFLDALRGNPDAVVLDRWMIKALNLPSSKGSLTPSNYKIYERVVRDLATANDMTPRQFQAAVWEGARVNTIHERYAKGGPQAVSKIGSARPLEDLVDRKLGGMSPEEYAKETQGHLKMMQNLYQTLKPVRTGIVKGEDGAWESLPDAPSGHTFDPVTFEPAAHEGHVVSVVSNSTARAHLYPARLLKFRSDVQPLISELEAKGLKPTIGVWQENIGGKPTGNFSLDLNVMMKDKGQAMELGRMARNFEIAKLGKGGEWQENIPTGYDPAINGKQFLPPKSWKLRDAWHKQQINRARAWVAKAEKLAPSSIITRMQSEAGRIGDVGTNPRHSVGNVLSKMQAHGAKLVPENAIVKQGSYGSMKGYFISPEGDVIDVGSQNGLTHARLARAVGKSIGLSPVRGYEGSEHGAGSEVQSLLNMGWIRAQTSGSMIAFDLSTGITDAQRSLMKKTLSTHEDWAAAMSNEKGKLVNTMSSHMGDKSHHFLAAATQHSSTTK
jgi:hypothetical protein